MEKKTDKTIKKDNTIKIVIVAIISIAAFFFIAGYIYYNNQKVIVPEIKENSPPVDNSINNDDISPTKSPVEKIPNNQDSTIQNTSQDENPINNNLENLPNLNITELWPKDAESMIENNTLVIIDTSSSVKFYSGHIKEALNYPYADGTLQKSVASFDKSREYLVYAYFQTDSVYGARLLASNGLKTYRLRGNYGLWLQEGRPTEKVYDTTLQEPVLAKPVPDNYTY